MMGATSARMTTSSAAVRTKPEYLGLQKILDEHLKDGAGRQILEAGCGSASHLVIPQACTITGIDISEKQLRRNPLLHERWQGDLETYPLPSERFDCVICWDVLEHLSRPAIVIENLLKTTKPDGLLVVAVPNRNSLKGLVTRLTPYWFHVLVYRVVYGKKNAGTNDVGPFPTYFRKEISVRRLKSFGEQHKIGELLFMTYAHRMIQTGRTRMPALFWLYDGLIALGKILSFGQYDASNSDVLLCWRKAAKRAHLGEPSSV